MHARVVICPSPLNYAGCVTAHLMKYRQALQLTMNTLQLMMNPLSNHALLGCLGCDGDGHGSLYLFHESDGVLHLQSHQGVMSVA